jgi:hypothetical protein
VQPSAFDRALVVSILAVVIEGKPAIILISSHADTRTWKLVTEKPAAGFRAKSSLSASAIQALICENTRVINRGR